MSASQSYGRREAVRAKLGTAHAVPLLLRQLHQRPYAVGRDLIVNPLPYSPTGLEIEMPRDGRIPTARVYDFLKSCDDVGIHADTYVLPKVDVVSTATFYYKLMTTKALDSADNSRQ